jgi:hypothetical protein
MTIERRTGGSCALAPTRAKGGSDARTIAGYASIFGAQTVIGNDLFREVVDRGAFSRALLKSDVRLLYNHDSNQLPLGRTSAGTLRVIEDARGLKYVATLPDSEQGRSLFAAIQRGDVRESSFQFILTKDVWEPPSRGHRLPLRRIVEVGRLMDVSAVTFPAYDSATVAVVDGTPKERSAMARECAATVAAIGDSTRALRVLAARASAKVCARCSSTLDGTARVIGTARSFTVVCPACAERDLLQSRRSAMAPESADMARRKAELARRERTLRAQSKT